MTSTSLFLQKNEWLKARYPEVDALTFYSEIFPPETLEKKDDKTFRASNPIFTTLQHREKDGKEVVYYQNDIVFRDTMPEAVQIAQKNDFALCSMCSYSGRRKTAKNAYKCHGFCIDLDGVGMRELDSFFGWVYDLQKIPCPTYVVNSGHGLHVYYIFNNPVPLYPKVVPHLQKLKRGLTGWVWNRETSDYKVTDRQYQGIFQSFRMVGSHSKLGKGKAKDRYRLRAYRTGDTWTIADLNEYVEPEFRAPVTPDYSSWEYSDNHKSLSECQVLYPEWYDKRIIQGEPAGQWICSKGLYDWWLDKLQKGAKDGNRYHCISVLYAMAVKCNIPKEYVDADAEDLIPYLDGLTRHEDNEFTINDVKAASEYYTSASAKMSRKTIEIKTSIRIDPARRNGRKQEVHLKRARKLREDDYSMVGRPAGSIKETTKKQAIVAAWQAEHPDGSKYACIKETGLSKMTVYKWWKEPASDEI